MNIDSKRIHEAAVLLEIASIAASLNRGSGFIEKIQKIEKLFLEIDTDDYETPRRSFLRWLVPALQQELPRDPVTELVRKHQIAHNDFTEAQLVETIRQALPDFVRHVHKDAQAVRYFPGSEAERWKAKYYELLKTTNPQDETPTP